MLASECRMYFVERSRLDVCQGKPDRQVVHTETSEQREVPANDVIGSLARRIAVSLGVERTRALFAEMPDGKSNHTTSAGCARENCRFHQPLKINGDVVAHLAHAPGDVDPRRYRRAFKDDCPVDDADQIDHRAMSGFDEPADPRVWKRVPQRGSCRDGMDDIAEGAKTDDEDVHPRIRATRSRVE